MIDKIDYGDLYKFRTSVGLIIIALSLVIPWLIIVQDKSIYLTYEEYKALGLQTKWLADYQRLFMRFFFIIVPIFSAIGLVFGYNLFRNGYSQWKTKQDSADEYEELILLLKRTEVKSMTSQEVDIRAQKEVLNDVSNEETLESENTETDLKAVVDDIDKRKEKLLDVEAKVFQKIIDYNTFNYNPQQNLKLSKFTFDIVLEAFNPNTKPDIIIEVKYLQINLNMVSIRNAFAQFITATSEYRRQTSRKAKMYFMVICSAEIGAQEDIERFRIALIDLHKEMTGSSSAYVMLFLRDEDLENYDIKSIVD